MTFAFPQLLTESRLIRGALISLLVCWAALTFSSALVEISFTVALILWLAAAIRTRRFPLEDLDLNARLLLLAYVMIVIFSYFWSEAPELSFRGLFKVLQQVMTFVLAADLLRQKTHLDWFARVTLGVFALMTANGFWQFFTGQDFIRHYSYQDSYAGARLTSSFKSYGLFANYLICLTPVIFGLALTRFHRPALKKALVLLLAAAGLVLLFKTRSRGAMIALAAAVFLVMLLKRKFLVLFLLSAVLGTGLLFVPKTMIIHLDINRKEQSLIERFYLWDRALQVISAKPLTGTGVNTYSAVHNRYDTRQNWRVRGYYAHNGYLQAAAETGIPGLLCLMGFFYLLMRQGWYSPGRKREEPLYLGLFTGTLAFLIFMAVDTVFHNPVAVMMFWLLLGALHASVSGVDHDQPLEGIA